MLLSFPETMSYTGIGPGRVRSISCRVLQRRLRSRLTGVAPLLALSFKPEIDQGSVKLLSPVKWTIIDT